MIKLTIARNILFDYVNRSHLRKRLHNTDFTIIASNCLGARIYQALGIEYNTPFVGLYIYAPCYIKLLSKLEHYLQSELLFVNKSKYCNDIPLSNKGKPYPIGLLGGEIEIHFQHFKSELEAKTKWNRRIKRMNLDNLYILFTDRDLCDETLLNQFDQMPFRHKVCFTAREYTSVKSSIYISEYKNQPYVGDMYIDFHILKRNFNFVDWLNHGKVYNGIQRDCPTPVRSNF